MNGLEMTEHLPKVILMLFETLFTEGQCVNDYKIVGNKHGHSITLHITHPSVQSELSPGKHRSPSTSHYSFQRQLNWQMHNTPMASDTHTKHEDSLQMNNMTINCSKGIKKDVIKDESEACIGTETLVTDSDIKSSIDISQCEIAPSEKDIAESEENVKINATAGLGDKMLSQTDDGKIGSYNGEEDDVRTTCSGTSTQNGQDDKEEQYRKRLLNPNRNKTFMKIVHDRRNEESKVYGQTDDLIIEVDEVKMKYQAYAIHDKERNRDCQRIFNLLQQWPDAIHSKCQYGVDTLRVMLPDIVLGESGVAVEAK